MNGALDETLRQVAAIMRDAAYDWWVIGSAAAALHDAAELTRHPPRDVDVLLAVEDAERLLPQIGLPLRAGRPDGLFRSTLFARWSTSALPIEFMAGLHVRDRPVLPATRTAVPLTDGTIFIPTRVELIELLRSFGRAKDVARADRLSDRSR